MYNLYKAGTEGLSRDQVKNRIEQLSAGSKFSEHQRKQEQKIQQRAQQFREHLQDLHDGTASFDWTECRSKVDEIMDDAVRDFKVSQQQGRLFAHIDMDAFFVAVEALERPELANRPMAVGGNSMLSTANYEARKYGVVSAMPGYIAKKLCPELIIIEPNMEKYAAMSQRVKAVHL